MTKSHPDFLAELCLAIATTKRKADLHDLITKSLRKILPVSDITVVLFNEDHRRYSDFFSDPALDHSAIDEIMSTILTSEKPLLFNLDELVRRPGVPAYLRMYYDKGMREIIFCPLPRPGCPEGALVLSTSKPGLIQTFSFIPALAALLAMAIEGVLAKEQAERQLEEMAIYKQQFALEQGLPENIRLSDEIIGTGAAMQKVLREVAKVAGSPAGVLLLGETGTGKEVIARTIHRLSCRNTQTMIRVNCAALPAPLIESELFGHERGSFTGATDRRIGKFEMANNSTLFLDEIGELPLHLQSKLLRALQEKEIERVGGHTVVKTDARIIAATNRDLLKEVQAGNFRGDLFFRLNIFPIVLPPLRDRREDIPDLARHFLQKHAAKNRRVTGFSSRALNELMGYSWPGNIRELEHVVERSLLMTAGSVIKEFQLPEERNTLRQQLAHIYLPTLAEMERDHIIRVLHICNGKVAGIGGAAEKLRIPATTLFSKIRRLNINKGCLHK